MTTIPQTYPERAHYFETQAQACEARYERLVWLRLGVFLLGVAAIIVLASWRWWAATLGAMLFLAGFYQFVQWHQRIQARARHLYRLAEINQLEDQSVAGDFAHGPDGARWIDPHHPYGLDLDLFGPYSLFQLLNRASTEAGQALLAHWLLQAAPPAEVLERQAAVREFGPQLNWRQELQAHGASLQEAPGHLAALRAWLNDPPVIAHAAGLRLARWLALPWFGMVVWLWIVYLPWFWALPLLLPTWALWSRRREAVDRLQLRTGQVARILLGYAQLLRHAETGHFSSPRLQHLQQQLAPSQGVPASAALRSLAYRLGQLDVRYNAFAVILQFSLLWDFQWAYQIDRWKASHGSHLFRWLDALAELEALSGLANLHHNHPGWAFPTGHAQPLLDAQGLGHPLIKTGTRVTNDLHIPTVAHLHLITGSNMAGKSTWLRTVGINVVLAQAGSVVCAQRLALPPLAIYTSMRTQDALHESTSSFYAELKRLKQLIDAVEHPTGDSPSVFFLLDEILKGTNSRDRHTGARALIRQLLRDRAAGLIATHDLELGALAATADGHIENWAMEVAIRDGQLHFDYRLQPGVSQSFNATLLMQQMGIRIANEDDPT